MIEDDGCTNIGARSKHSIVSRPSIPTVIANDSAPQHPSHYTSHNNKGKFVASSPPIADETSGRIVERGSSHGRRDEGAPPRASISPRSIIFAANSATVDNLIM